MIKKFFLTIVLIGICIVLYLPIAVKAASVTTTADTDVLINEADVMITFEKGTSGNSGEKKPSVIDSGGDKSRPKLLPQTGEIIASMIIILIGIAIAIFVLGLIVLKQVYREEISWEY